MLCHWIPFWWTMRQNPRHARRTKPPVVHVVRGVAGGVDLIVVAVGEVGEGGGVAGFNAMCRVPFDILLGSPRRLVMKNEDWAHTLQFDVPKILCRRSLLSSRVAI